MNPAQLLHEAGQSLWLDSISRKLLASGTLSRYVAELAVTGLTSNPTILGHAMAASTEYDEALGRYLAAGLSDPQELVYAVAFEDLRAAADLFRPIWEETQGSDGYVSVEVPPGLAYDAAATVEVARRLHAQAERPNVLIKVPGTPAGLSAMEALITDGIGINVTLLFSPTHYLQTADAYLRALERRSAAAHRNVAEYSGADRHHIASGPPRVRRAVAERITAVRDEFPDQSQLVTKQASLMRRFMPMRDLYQAAPDVLGALKPCWAMSPLVVSQLLPMQQCFDVAIFDEASQVTPQDAAGVICRAGQLVVAGDPHQLPPTTFFAPSGGGVDDEAIEVDLSASLVADVESVLDQMIALLPPPVGTRSLAWHYRSRDERLIAFSNAQPSLYDYSMTTFPGVAADDTIRHVHVPFRPGRPGEEDSASDEVEKVIELVAEHARTRPGESLGVIAMGIKHANRIEESLRRARLPDDILDDFVTGRASSTAAGEPLFVKNLERVQGDERDSVILTVGYTKNPDGRMLYRFGPLNNAGGERRLNVAITRARRHMTVVSSFTAADMDPDRLKAEGAKMLSRYLAYAESAGTSLGEAARDKPDLNPFERDVQAQLTKAGIPLVAQWGSSGYWIDYVAKHPTQPGRMVLAIECDGATYHSSPTARDRDRLRQEHLERLGWRFHRIWSTEWFRHRDAETARVVAAYQAAVAGSEDPTRRAGGGLRIDGTYALRGPELSRTNAAPPVPQRKGSGPVRPGLGGIAAYSHRQLVALIRWIESDTLLRTEDELLGTALAELGFQKRGKNIVAALQAAIADARQ